MPRRSVLTEAQRADLLALPEDEAALVRHWTLSAEDLRIIVSRRRVHNRLGFAIQVCGLRYPWRLLRPDEVIRHAPLAFVGEQLGIPPEVLADMRPVARPATSNSTRCAMYSASKPSPGQFVRSFRHGSCRLR